MFKNLIAKLDAVAGKILLGLQALYNGLTDKLDRALDKLDEMTRGLLRKYYRALDYLEKLFRILLKLLRVLVPIVLLYVPPVIGFAIAYFASESFEAYRTDAIIVGVMSAVLFFLLVASFLSKGELGEAAKTSAPVPVIAGLDKYSLEKKVIGVAIALIFLVALAYLSLGFFVGVLLFIFEVLILYSLKWIFGTDKSQPASTPA